MNHILFEVGLLASDVPFAFRIDDGVRLGGANGIPKDEIVLERAEEGPGGGGGGGCECRAVEGGCGGGGDEGAESETALALMGGADRLLGALEGGGMIEPGCFREGGGGGPGDPESHLQKQSWKSLKLVERVAAAAFSQAG